MLFNILFFNQSIGGSKRKSKVTFNKFDLTIYFNNNVGLIICDKKKVGLRGVFLQGHKQVVSWIDEWIDMTLDDIRAYEDETKRIMDEVSTFIIFFIISYF